jgi:hypothetical protein
MGRAQKAAVDDIFSRFIKGFGVLSGYAVHARYTLALAAARGFLMRRYGKSMADRQEMNRVEGFSLNKGRYPWDVV